MNPPTTTIPKWEPAGKILTVLFCERFHCSPAEFEELAFKKCLYGHARLLAPVIRWLSPAYFAEDMALIHYLGNTPGRREAKNELAAFIEHTATKGRFVRKNLCIRVSVKKAGALANELFGMRTEGRAPRILQEDTSAAGS